MLRTLLVLPWAIPAIVNGLMWQWMFNGQVGVINGLLRLRKSSTSTDPGSATRSGRLASSSSRTCGTSPRSPRSSSWPRSRRSRSSCTRPRRWTEPGRCAASATSTLPWLASALLVVVLLQTIYSLRVFDLVYVLTGGGSGDATNVMSWAAYHQAFTALSFGVRQRLCLCHRGDRARAGTAVRGAPDEAERGRGVSPLRARGLPRLLGYLRAPPGGDRVPLVPVLVACHHELDDGVGSPLRTTSLDSGATDPRQLSRLRRSRAIRRTGRDLGLGGPLRASGTASSSRCPWPRWSWYWEVRLATGWRDLGAAAPTHCWSFTCSPGWSRRWRS